MLRPQNRPAGVGLTFVGLSSNDRERICSCVSKFYELAAQLER